MSELLAMRVPGLRQRNGLERKLGELTESIADQLEPWCERELRGLPDNERRAALDAVGDAFSEADLCDTTILKSDLDPTALALEVRQQVPSAAHRANLNQDATVLFDRLLDQVCVQLVHLVKELPEFEPRVAQEQLARLSSVLERLDTVLERLPKSTVDAPSGHDRDQSFLLYYRDLLARTHDELDLIGVPVRTFRPRTRLSVAYLSLTVSGEGGNRKGRGRLPDPRWLAEAEGAHDRGASSMRVEAALSSADRVLVRGEAGSGKSTLLRWLAVTAAREKFSGKLSEWNGRTPVLIKLRSYAKQPLPRPEQFLDERSGLVLGPPIPEGWMHRQFASGRGLLLVDGVDELGASQREGVREWVAALLNSYPGTRVVVTSRPAAAGMKWLRDEGFTSVMVEQMTPTDVRVFLDRWYDALLASAGDTSGLPFDRSELDRHRRDLLTQLNTRSNLRALTNNPLMCAMLCALHLDRGSHLPKDRKSLYEAALEMLLDRRDGLRNIPAGRDIDLSYPDKLVLLQALAWWLNDNGRAELPKETAIDLVTRTLRSIPGLTGDHGRAVLEYLLQRSGVLREPVHGRIDFVHRTFQEFLAAREAAESSSVGRLIKEAHSDQWRETVVMAAGLFNRPLRAELLSGILDRADRAQGQPRRQLRLLAATCQESVRDLPPDVIERLTHCVRQLLPPRDKRESRSLATVGEPILEYLPTNLQGFTGAQSIACIRTVALVNGQRALGKLAQYSTDTRSEVQEELADVWELFEPEAYARQVLAHIPADDGRILIRRLEHVAHAALLPQAKRLHILLLSEFVNSLEFLNDIPPVHQLFAEGSEESGTISLQPLRRHPDIERLTLVRAVKWSDISVLRRLHRLRHLALHQTQALRGISFLRNLPLLEWLSLGALNRIEDYTALEELRNLRILALTECARLPNLADLNISRELHELTIEKAPSSDIVEQVSHFPKLTYFTLINNSVSDLTPLGRLSKLKRIDLWKCPNVSDLSPLAELPVLRRVTMFNCGPTLDLSPLAGCKLTIILSRDQAVRGADDLGSDITIERR